MTHRRKVARRKPWKRRQRLYKLYGKETVDLMFTELLTGLKEAEDKAILYGEGISEFGPKGILYKE